jgi:hypothetical protein
MTDRTLPRFVPAVGMIAGLVLALPGNAQTFDLPPVQLSAGDEPRFVRAVDLNADGHTDLVVGNVGSNDLSILLATGSGAFADETRIPLPVLGFPLSDINVGDFDNDDIPDLIAVGLGIDGNFILLGNGDGTFQPPQAFTDASFPSRLANGPSVVADFDRDGNADIVACSFNKGLLVAFGRGDGTFDPRGDESGIPGISAANGVHAANLDDNDTPDLIFAPLPGGLSGFGTLLNDAGREFPPYRITTFPFFVTLNGVIASADLDDDGDQDLLVASNSQLYLVENLGIATYAPPVALGIDARAGLALVDLDADGNEDIVAVGSAASGISIARGNGDLTFQPTETVAGGAIGATRAGLAIADIDTGGQLDVIVCNPGADTVEVFLNALTLPPSFLADGPESTVVNAMGTLVLEAPPLLGEPPLSFTWRREGVDLVDDDRIGGTDSATLVITGATPEDAGTYDLVVSNSLGQTSGAATVVTVRRSLFDANNDGFVDFFDLVDTLSELFSD